MRCRVWCCASSRVFIMLAAVALQACLVAFAPTAAFVDPKVTTGKRSDHSRRHCQARPNTKRICCTGFSVAGPIFSSVLPLRDEKARSAARAFRRGRDIASDTRTAWRGVHRLEFPLPSIVSAPNSLKRVVVSEWGGLRNGELGLILSPHKQTQ